MLFALKKILTALVLPPTGLVVLAALGLWLTRWQRRAGQAVAGAALLAIVLLSLPLVSDALMRSLERLPPVSAQQLARAQALVVLGGGNYAAAPEYGTDTVNRETLERLRYGAWLQRRTGLPILVTGGAPSGGRPEGEAMREALEQDFHATVKWTEAASLDTADNAAFSAALLKAEGVRRVALISHARHLPRAIELFERQGLEVLAAPTAYTMPAERPLWQFLPSAGALADSGNALREWLGIAVQRVAPGAATR